MENVSGIYMIQNTVTGDDYIGSSVNIKKRWSVHQWHLREQTHPNQHLQNSWNKYGKGAFAFYILEGTTDLRERELHWLYQCKPTFNMNYAVDRLDPDGLGFCCSEETRRKLSVSHLGQEPGNKGKHPSDETRKKLSEAHMGQEAYWKGKSLTDEAKKKISEKLTGRHSTEEQRRKQSESLKGRVFTPEHCQKISEGKTGTHRKPATTETREKLSLAMQGNSWNKGRKHVAKTRQKISDALTGRQFTEDHCNNLSVALIKYWQRRKGKNATVINE
jgi:group I intron endonuclease